MQYCGLGFNPRDDNSTKVLTQNNGIFHWSEAVCNRVKTFCLKKGGKCKDHEIKLKLVGYLFELFYDLMLDTSENLSTNPGFEFFLGIFNNTND